MQSSIDLLAVGDVVVDDFIKLKDAHVTCKIDNEACEICMRWGDKIPFEFSIAVPAVGNASNAAVSASRLGLRSALRAYIGEDEHGQACLAALMRDKVDTTYVEKQAGKHTNYHYVLWFGSERTILVKHEAYDYALPPIKDGPRWLYLSSLGENSLPYHYAWAEKLKQWPQTKLAFQPGTYQISFEEHVHWAKHKEELTDIYKRTDIFFCNKEEAEKILGVDPTGDIKSLLMGIQALGPKDVIITNDRKGACALSQKGEAWFVPMYPDQPAPVERTGAGDAFASSVVSALALGKPLEEALLWGPINAMSVVMQVGAQKGLLSREQVEHYLAIAPEGYRLGAL